MVQVRALAEAKSFKSSLSSPRNPVSENVGKYKAFAAPIRAGTAAALGAMHHRVEAPWTVASLAEEVGLSRSVFAARFTQLVGEPPLAYLTRLRMQKAAALLRDGATLARVSQMTGYASEASFSHAFRQWAGVAPGAWRKKRKPVS